MFRLEMAHSLLRTHNNVLMNLDGDGAVEQNFTFLSSKYGALSCLNQTRSDLIWCLYKVGSLREI